MKSYIFITFVAIMIVCVVASIARQYEQFQAYCEKTDPKQVIPFVKPDDNGNLNNAVIPYKGYYGQSLALRINPGDQQGPSIHIQDGSNLVELDDDNYTILTLRLVTAYRQQKTIRKSNEMVYLKDTFNIYVPSRDQYINITGEGTFQLSSTSALFMLKQKYGSLCDQESMEYEESVNNRYLACDFPYVDCFRRCGMRQLLINHNNSWVICGKQNRGRKLAIKGIGNWTTYEFMVITVHD